MKRVLKFISVFKGLKKFVASFFISLLLFVGSPDLKVLTPQKVYTNKRRFHEVAVDTADESHKELIWSTPQKRRTREKDEYTDTPRCKKLKTLLKDTNNKLRRSIMKNKYLKHRATNKNIVDLSKHKFRSESSKLLALMQFKKPRTSWTEEEKKFCMSLYYKSPAAYKYMLKSGIVLASTTTIQRWLQETNCQPGINEEVFENIKNKFSHKSVKERACVVCFDEMSIMTNLEYTSKYDLIEGFEDFGNGERNGKEAKYALVFIARGLYINWKIPVAYFLGSRTIESSKLKTIIENVISKLFESGLLPKVTVCDQATTNVKVIKDLGATIDYPFYFLNGRKIFAIFDVPHLIKNVRNNLINNNFYLNGSQISFSDIVYVYNTDQSNKSKSVRKLSAAHINPNNFQKMKVKLATQVLSKSVSAAIQTAIQSGELKNDTAQHTAHFVNLCNDLFDCLNSKNKFDRNPYRCAITKNQNSEVNLTLIKGKKTFCELQKITINKKNERQLTRPPCFDGMVQTINAVLQLSAEEFTPGTGNKFLLTYRLNQDVIENLFGIYRLKGGCNRNPTSRSLRSTFRSNFLNNLITFEKTNCESDQDLFIPTATTNQENTRQCDSIPSTSMQQGYIGENIEGPLTELPILTQSSNIIEITRSQQNLSLETCSVVYFAGWIGKSCIDKFDCSDCKKKLLNNLVDLNDKKQLLLINKTYSNISVPTLKSPTEYLVNLVDNMLDCFQENIDQLHRSNVISNLMDKFKNKTNFHNQYHNLDHFDYLIRKLMEVKIHDFCKSRKKSLQSASKLRILQNK